MTKSSTYPLLSIFIFQGMYDYRILNDLLHCVSNQKFEQCGWTLRSKHVKIAWDHIKSDNIQTRPDSPWATNQRGCPM